MSFFKHRTHFIITGLSYLNLYSKNDTSHRIMKLSNGKKYSYENKDFKWRIKILYTSIKYYLNICEKNDCSTYRHKDQRVSWCPCCSSRLCCRFLQQQRITRNYDKKRKITMYRTYREDIFIF